MPSFSIERRLSVSTFWLMPSKSFFSSLKRQVRICRLRIIKSFHLLPIKATVVATGQAGLDTWKDYVQSLGKPMNDIFIVCHPAGASYIKGMNVYGTEGAQKSIVSGSTGATTQGLFAAFGADFHGGPEVQDAVAEKISYLNKTKEIMQQSKTADEFKANMKAAFPAYDGENYLDMTAGFLYK